MGSYNGDGVSPGYETEWNNPEGPSTSAASVARGDGEYFGPRRPGDGVSLSATIRVGMGAED